MNQKRKHPYLSIIGIVLLSLFAVVGGVAFFDAVTDQAQAADPLTPTVRTLTVQPSKGANGTNGCAVFYSKDGTNFFRVNPTNAVLEYMYLGTLYSGATSNILSSNTTTGAKTMLFRNGLLIGVQ